MTKIRIALASLFIMSFTTSAGAFGKPDPDPFDGTIMSEGSKRTPEPFLRRYHDSKFNVVCYAVAINYGDNPSISCVKVDADK